MTALILHYAPDNASLCVRLALEAAQLPYRTALVDRSRSAQKSAAYTALNPNGLIPVLETPDGAIFETAAILLWLSEQAPGLMPRCGPDRAEALKWLIWMANTLHPALRMLFYPGQFAGPGETAALSQGTRARLVDLLSIADAGLKDSAVIGQAAPTALDCYLCPMLRWVQLYPIDAPSRPQLADFPVLTDIARRNEGHPGTRAAMRAEGLGPRPFTAPGYPNPPEGSAL